MPTLSLRQGEVDLWCVDSSSPFDEPLLAAYRELLSADERQRERRLKLPAVRLQYLLSRALVRTVLSHYSSADPGSWQFRTNAYGKPDVAGPVDPPVDFNLSHTRGMVICGVTRGGDIGVDVEAVKWGRDDLQLARRYFAAAETRTLESLHPAERGPAFFAFWTLKEAFVKARGLGLSIPLDAFAFTLAADRPPQIAFPRPDHDDAGHWRFAQLTVNACFQLAVAVAGAADDCRLTVRVRQTVPLRWSGDFEQLPANPTNRWKIRWQDKGVEIEPG